DDRTAVHARSGTAAPPCVRTTDAHLQSAPAANRSKQAEEDCRYPKRVWAGERVRRRRLRSPCARFLLRHSDRRGDIAAESTSERSNQWLPQTISSPPMRAENV